MRFEHEAEIARTPHEVYAYLSEPANLPEWQGQVEEVRPLSQTRFVEVRHFLGRRVESELEVAAAEPGREFSLRVVSGPVRAHVRHLLDEAGEGRTRLRVEVEAEAQGVPRLVAGAASRTARRQTEKDFARLKQLLEAGP